MKIPESMLAEIAKKNLNEQSKSLDERLNNITLPNINVSNLPDAKGILDVLKAKSVACLFSLGENTGSLGVEMLKLSVKGVVLVGLSACNVINDTIDAQPSVKKEEEASK